MGQYLRNSEIHDIEDRILDNWHNFPELNEEDQARFLLNMASSAWKKQEGFDEIKWKVEFYIQLGHDILNGDFNKIKILIYFLDDPYMKEDFGYFFEQLKYSEKASAALDLASYACGFVCRLSAEKANIHSLPDPVLEALPDIYEYFYDKIKIAGLIY